MTQPADRRFVLDASALLAAVRGEPGGDAAFEAALRGVVSAVNWSEVVQKVLQASSEPDVPIAALRGREIEIAPFGRDDAERAAALWPARRARGLSLADRACLALAIGRGLPVVTADRTWAQLGLGVEVVVIR
ncbi:MAG: type II toxin-antitoxin system VapC family toxin [Tepidiformaceae bacterium]